MVVTLLLLVSCGGSGDPGAVLPTPTGAPTIDFDLVRQHALQFDVDVPSRPPGSQHELAAATYILGHLQLAGYAPLLDAVPVRDQVQSTNVVAWPPTGADPEVVVAVAYDDDGSGIGEGKQIGLFLELARALNIAAPDHQVAFVALGAETDEYRGSRKLARTLADRDLQPQLILFRGASGSSLSMSGACVQGFDWGGDLVEEVDDCIEAGGYTWLDDATLGATHIEGAGEQGVDALFRLLQSTAD